MLTILGIALAATAIAVGTFMYFFRNEQILVQQDKWGQFGDFFGGTLNPVFGFLSVMALLVALVIQSRELRLSRKALKLSRRELKLSRKEQEKSVKALDAQHRAIEHQRFEQTFFAWLGTYRELLEAIEIIDVDAQEPNRWTGRRAIHYWWENRLTYQSIYAYKVSPNDRVQRSKERQRALLMLHMLPGSPDEELNELTSDALAAWEVLYCKWEYWLDNFFRVLYRLLLWIDSQDAEKLSDAQKWLYASIVRSQLSWIELVFLFYNGQTERGEKFKRLVEKYALFDNLNFSDPVLKNMRAYPPQDGAYSEAAYKSSVAREAMGLPPTIEETLALAAR